MKTFSIGKYIIIAFLLCFIDTRSFEKNDEKQEKIDRIFLDESIKEALLGLSENGVPVGSVLVYDNKIIGRGHNMMMQTGNPILHAEMSAISNAGRLSSKIYRNSTLYTSLSPCPMCTGAINLFQIPKIVIADNTNYKSKYGETLLKKLGRDVKILENDKSIKMMSDFIKFNNSIWKTDIGESEITIASSSANDNINLDIKFENQFLQNFDMREDRKSSNSNNHNSLLIIVTFVFVILCLIYCIVIQIRRSDKLNSNYILVHEYISDTECYI